MRPSRASYMREYRKTSGKVMRYREFRRGVETMRQAAQKLFRGQIGEGSVDGYTAANMLSMVNPSENSGDGDFIGSGSERPSLVQG